MRRGRNQGRGRTVSQLPDLALSQSTHLPTFGHVGTFHDQIKKSALSAHDPGRSGPGGSGRAVEMARASANQAPPRRGDDRQRTNLPIRVDGEAFLSQESPQFVALRLVRAFGWLDDGPGELDRQLQTPPRARDLGHELELSGGERTRDPGQEQIGVAPHRVQGRAEIVRQQTGEFRRAGRSRGRFALRVLRVTHGGNCGKRASLLRRNPTQPPPRAPAGLRRESACRKVMRMSSLPAGTPEIGWTLMPDHDRGACGAPSHPDAIRPQIELAYRRWPLLADYLRGWAGVALAALPLATMAPAWPVRLGLVALIGLFAGFLLQTWRRQRSRILLAEGGLAVTGTGERHLAWRDLDALRLRWFGSRSQGRGWLELELQGGGVKVVVTSALERFDELVADAVQAANDRGLPLEPSTRANVQALLKRAA